ncbi:MAG: hypothetical protein OIN66_11620 [Candidatus Methanoperedens sp.]|nr:hypothetical protein [Candidatus Methanoperedens sp.]
MDLMRILPFTTRISSAHPLDQVEESSTAEISTDGDAWTHSQRHT